VSWFFWSVVPLEILILVRVLQCLCIILCRAIRIPSSTEIEDAEIGLLDDYKSGNVSKGMNGIANGTQNGLVSSTPLTSPVSSLRRGFHTSK